MRQMVIVSALAATVYLTGCQGSKEQKMDPFVPMPAEMECSTGSVWKDATPATEGAKPAPPATAPAGNP